MLVDEILHHLEPDKSLYIVPSVVDREEFFLEAHCGPFGGLDNLEMLRFTASSHDTTGDQG